MIPVPLKKAILQAALDQCHGASNLSLARSAASVISAPRRTVQRDEDRDERARMFDVHVRRRVLVAYEDADTEPALAENGRHARRSRRVAV
jgi:hypothetical protein